MTRLCLSLVSALVGTVGLFAQVPIPKVEMPAPSPACTLRQRVGLTDFEIVYSRPGMKGRAIFGGLLAYGTVWRTGANASTKISFNTPVKFNGMEIPAGKYALYTIPGEKEWTVIIYRDTSLWGAVNYDTKNDLVRFTVKPEPLAEPVETFTIDLNDIRDDSATLNLSWERTRVPIKLELDITDKIVAQIEAAMASPAKKSASLYYSSALFYFYHGRDLNRARTWVDAALADQLSASNAYELYYLKAEILAKQGDKAGALAAAQKSTELAIVAEGPQSGFVKMNADLVASLK